MCCVIIIIIRGPTIIIIIILIKLSFIDFRPLPHPFVLYAPWKGGSSLSLGPGQPWPCLDLFRYWPFSLESPSTFSSCFILISQSFYVLITSENLSLFLELIEPKEPLFAYGCCLLRGAI